LAVELAGQHSTEVLALEPGCWLGGFAMCAEVPASFAFPCSSRLALRQLSSKGSFDYHQVFGY